MVTISIILGGLLGGKVYTLGHIITETIRIVCINNFGKYPKITIHNLFIFGLIYYYFLMNLFFQCQVTSILMKKSYTKDIDTIQELYDSRQEIYAFANQIEEIQKIYSATNYSGIVELFKPFPEFTSLWETNRDAVYKISISEPVLRAFVTNYDRALFLTRSRVYRKNGRYTKIQFLHMI